MKFEFLRTNPCTKVAIWNSYEMQQEVKKPPVQETQEIATNTLTNQTTITKKLAANYEIVKSIVKKHRSVEINLNYQVGRTYELIKCRCVSMLESSIVFWTLEGPCCSEAKLFLLLGLEVSLEVLKYKIFCNLFFLLI